MLTQIGLDECTFSDEFCVKHKYDAHYSTDLKGIQFTPKTLVLIRTKESELIKAPLEFEEARAFAVLHGYGPKRKAAVIKSERVELDRSFLEKTNPEQGTDYFYKKEISLPNAADN